MDKASERTGSCLKEVGNWSKIAPAHRFDRAEFSRETVLRDMEYAAPKLKALLDNIVRLDAEDLKRDGRVYKHFIYSDIKSSYGAKLIASGLAAYGFEHAYKIAKGARGMSFQIDPTVTRGDGDHRGRAFAVLTSVSFFEKNVGVNFRKELLRMYNSRPENVYGDKIRVIVLDSGFREGVDLFDVRYAHLFEPIATVADEKQAVGRVTRYCGQKGLDFHPLEGWPVQVYRYETELPKAIKRVLYAQMPMLEPASSFFDLFMKFSNIDPKKINFANELADVSIRAAVDSVLTENIHRFKIPSAKAVGGTLGSGSATRSPGRKHAQFQERIVQKYGAFKWPPVRVENGCMGVVKPITASASASPSTASTGATSATSATSYRSTKSSASWNESVGMGSRMIGGAPVVLPFTPTQDFIRNYFTPSFKHSGMLLWHSVGTGKTCTAIATASSSFEKENYSIIYVTRHTLKGDVWKNMFDQVCSVILQERLAKGLELPELQAQRMRLLEKRWLEPMSYRQFSNMLDGRSQLGAELIKRNGRADPLHKTLVIIDEAHKLFAPDVAGSEKPDIDVIRKAFDTSREVSGSEGVKLLFMTATPYTSQPMDLLRLLNLLRPVSQKFPEDFEEFSKVYLNADGRFTEEGKLRYWDAITGYISYLNREKDIRTFSYAKFHEIRVPMTNYEFDFLVQDVMNERLRLEQATTVYKSGKQKLMDDLKGIEDRFKDATREVTKAYRLRHEDCTDELKVEYKLQENKEKETLNSQLAKCKAIGNKCLDELRDQYEKDKKALNDAAKKALAAHKASEKIEGGAGRKKKTDVDANIVPEAEKKAKKTKKVKKADADADAELEPKAIRKQLKVDLQRLAESYAFDKELCKEDTAADIERCVAEAKKDYAKRLGDLPKPDLTSCDPILQELQEKMKSETEKKERSIEVTTKFHNKSLDIDRERMESIQKSFDMMTSHLESMVASDRSQRLRVEKCLGLKPAYQRALKGDPAILDVVVESGPVIDEAMDTAIDNDEIKKNLFLVLGHGSERPESVSARLRMPKDKILVIFPVCSRPNYMNLACKFMHEYKKKENHKLFADPLRNKDRIMQLIQQPMHIFLPGEHVPNLSTDLFLVFKKAKFISVAKSGVYRITNMPEINRERLPASKYNLGSDYCHPFIGQIESEGHYNNAVHHEMYKGNLFKPVQTKKGYSEMSAGNYSLQTIMGEVGTGVYYYIGCRSALQVPSNLYERILAKSEEQQNAPGRSARLTDLEKILLQQREGERTPSPIQSPNVSAPSPSPPKPVIGETLISEVRRIQKRIEALEEKLVKRHFSSAVGVDGKDGADEAVDAQIVEWANAFERLKEAPVDEPSDEEKQRMRRKAILQGKKMEMIVTKETVLAAIEEGVKSLEFLAFIRMHPDNYTSSFASVVEGKMYKKFIRKATYTQPENKKIHKTFDVETLGYIPANRRDVALKCSSDLLSKNILKLMTAGVFPSIPQKSSEWATTGTAAVEQFAELCKDVRMLLTTIDG